MTQILLLWTSAGLKRIKAQLLDLDRVSSSPALTPVTVDATIVRLRINMDLRDQRLSLFQSLLKVFTINRHSCARLVERSIHSLTIAMLTLCLKTLIKINNLIVAFPLRWLEYLVYDCCLCHYCSYSWISAFVSHHHHCAQKVSEQNIKKLYLIQKHDRFSHFTESYISSQNGLFQVILVLSSENRKELF